MVLTRYAVSSTVSLIFLRFCFIYFQSFFFWSNGGACKGPHTGLIEQRTNNMRKKVPKENRKFMRKTSCSLNSDEEDRHAEAAKFSAEKCATLTPTPENCHIISYMMYEATPLHKSMLSRNRSVSDIIRQFPHLRSYHGLLVFTTNFELKK